jgi:hypothetical protein
MEYNRDNHLETEFFSLPPPCHHISLVDFVVSPPGCGQSVTDFCGWDAHEAEFCFLGDMGDDTYI